ncbi:MULTISPECIES: GxxExxY protein [unclassified Spirosoma]|uniref:GxxExxY protein n=1 Tax=unclassified Spirosoma TaxID=2621999 RepID=UPI000963E6F3|nr:MULTISPECIES: GxxExxY protein [unclassified Spirosoma]MBN8825944.1 GxxExxY protein [Spirosoma sp.]OJW70978.1 MAG: GxxExxY protein [Spirosoma sp. 48-14]
MVNSKYKYSELTGRIIGCAFEVHKILGNGFQEVIYQRALVIDLDACGIIYTREFDMPIYFKGRHVGSRRVDFLVENTLSIELKAIAVLTDDHLAQAINYLEAYNLEIGMLINFGSPSLQVKRLLNKKFMG